MSNPSEEIPSTLQRIFGLTIGDEIPVLVGHRMCWIRIVKRELEPTLPNFVGVVNLDTNEFFMSEDVPDDFRDAFTAHEVNCLHDMEKDLEHHCRNAIDYEFDFVPDGKREEYLRLRHKLFTDLVEFFKAKGNPGLTEFIGEIAAGRDRYAELLLEYV